MQITKSITKIWMLIALLLMATAAGAQNVINLKSHPHWECEYELDTKVSFSGANAVETGDMKGPELSYRVYEADLNPGGTLNIKTVSQCLTRGDHKAAKYKAEISLQFFKEDTSSPLGKRIVNGGGTKTADSKVLSISCKVPKEADIAKVTVSVDGPMARVGTILHLTYKRPGMRSGQSKNSGNANKQTSTSKRPSWWKEREPEPISRCDHPLSGISINDLCGEVSVRCNDDEDDSYEFAELDGLIREEDRIRTKEESEVLLGLEDMNTYLIRPNSIVVIRTEKNNVTKLEMIVGSIWANIKKMAEGKTIELEMSHCVSGIKGTIVAFEETGKESRVYLFAGKVEVTGKASKRKTMLKAGQASIVGSDGKIKVKKFDIEKGAKKFGIPMKEIKNHYSNTPTSSSKGSSTKVSSSGTISEKVQKRYAMQRGVIKYKYAKGKQTGEIIRTFDSYGHYERVASKIKGSSATSLNIYRGEKAYKVDTKAKTVTQSKHEAINFLNITEAELSKHKLKKKGTATVAGKQCVVYGNANEDYYVWQGITLKKVINSKDGKIVSEAVSITQPAKIDANKFKVPSNYTLK